MGAHEQDGCSWARSLAISSLLTSTNTVYFRVPLRPGPVFFSRELQPRWWRAVGASWMPLWPLGQSAGTHGREAAV